MISKTDYITYPDPLSLRQRLGHQHYEKDDREPRLRWRRTHHPEHLVVVDCRQGAYLNPWPSGFPGAHQYKNVTTVAFLYWQCR